MTIRKRLAVLAGIALVLAGLVPTFACPSVAMRPARAAALTVCPAGPPLCDYATIQAAVDAADTGDTIKVAAGTYTDLHSRPAPPWYGGTGPITQVVYLDKDVTIRGGYTTTNGSADPPDLVANPTTLDAQGQGRVLFVAAETSVLVEGLRLTGGNADGLGGNCSGQGGPDGGGGVYILWGNPILRDTAIYSNTADAGGGVCICAGSTVLEGNAISNNTADYGGGLYLYKDAATLTGNTVTGNGASVDGGGGYLYSQAALVTGNILSGNTAHGDGGGLYVYGSCTLDDNTVAGNMAGWRGGGLYIGWNRATLQRNRILGNTAGRGGGLWLERSTSTLDNSLVIENVALDAGAGLVITGTSGVRLAQTTIQGNTGAEGSGVYVDNSSAAWLTNTILVSQTAGLLAAGGSQTIVDGILWFANGTNISGTGVVTISGAITASPALDLDGYHLTAGSPAIDAGVRSLVQEDVDHQFRPMRWGYDLGADEYPGVGLEIVKAVQWPTLVPPNLGQAFTYTVAITAAGSGDASNVVVTDTLPGVQRALAAYASAGPCSLEPGWGGRVVCSPGSIVSGTNVLVTISAVFSTTAQPGQEVVNTVLVRSADTADEAQARTHAQDCHVRLNNVSTEYTYVQAAVDAAAPGDVVKIAGTCLDAIERGRLWQQVYLTKSMTLRGGYSRNFANWDPQVYPTTLDARGQGRVLYGNGTAEELSLALEALNITGGYANYLGGGGIYALSATIAITSCEIYSNTGEPGGGLCLGYANVTLNDSIISGNQAVFDGGGLYLGHSRAWLDGNTLAGNSSHGHGGGLCLHQSEATLTDNSIISNTVGPEGKALGGGIALLDGSRINMIGNSVSGNVSWGSAGGVCLFGQGTAILTGNTFTHNNAGEDGGGLYLLNGTATLQHNVVRENEALSGGGLYARGSVVLASGTLFSTNQSRYGGGLALYGGEVTLTHNVVASNTADLGGGLYQSDGSSFLTGNTIRGNDAAAEGGGLYVVDGNVTLDNNLLIDNQATSGGAGLHAVGASLAGRHNTLADNRGDGSSGILAASYYSYESTIALTNTILVSHTTGISVSAGCTATLEATLWGIGAWGNDADWGGAGTIFTGTVNVWGDPAFLDPAAGDYHIGPGSAALDQGVVSALHSDIDHQPRPYLLPDLGADEYWPPGVLRYFYLPLLPRGSGEGK